MTLKRLMPPSVTYSYTIAASCSPDCGRAAGMFSTCTSNGADRLLGVSPLTPHVVSNAVISTAPEALIALTFIHFLERPIKWSTLRTDSFEVKIEPVLPRYLQGSWDELTRLGARRGSAA